MVALESGSDVCIHLSRPVDEMRPVVRAEPDHRSREDRLPVVVKQPTDVIGVQLGTDDVSDRVSGGASVGQPGE
jgi:hypothetical protein